MGKWFPAIYDLVMKPLEKKKFKSIRVGLIKKAKGRVLEIGSGSGVNFPLYQQVSQVDSIEPNQFMLEQSRKRSENAEVPIFIHQAKAENLPFPDNTFDSVVATLVFCTIPEPELALKEVLRVSKNGATILFFEHVKMPQPLLAKSQEILTPLWKIFCDGCCLDRDTLYEIRKAGFLVDEVESYSKGLFITVACTIQK